MTFSMTFSPTAAAHYKMCPLVPIIHLDTHTRRCTRSHTCHRRENRQPDTNEHWLEHLTVKFLAETHTPTLQHTVTHGNTPATYCNSCKASSRDSYTHTATHGNTTATHCNTPLQQTVTAVKILAESRTCTL